MTQKASFDSEAWYVGLTRDLRSDANLVRVWPHYDYEPPPPVPEIRPSRPDVAVKTKADVLALRDLKYLPYAWTSVKQFAILSGHGIYTSRDRLQMLVALGKAEWQPRLTRWGRGRPMQVYRRIG